MNKLKLIFLISVFTFVMFEKASAQAKDNPLYDGDQTDIEMYVSIIFEKDMTRENCLTIDNFIRAKDGVIMSRASSNRNDYFGVYNSSSTITINDYLAWFEELDFEVKCFKNDKKSNGIKLLILEDCK